MARLYGCIALLAMAGCAFHVPGVAGGGGGDDAEDLGGVGGNGGAGGGGGGGAGGGGGGGGAGGGGGGGGGGVVDVDLAMPLDLAMLPPDLSTTGELTVTRDTPPGMVSLTDEGLIDWAHFGRNTAGDINRKADGPASITLATVNANLAQFNNYATQMKWSNGAPTGNASSKAGVFVTGVEHAIVLSVPADTTTRTMRAYLTHYRSQAELVVHLSDGSAPDYKETLTTGPNTYYRVTARFRARGPGERLTLTWTERADNGFGSVDVQSVTLY